MAVKKILDEEYVPDADNLVRIRGLGKFCELALWGVWCLDYAPQSTASGRSPSLSTRQKTRRAT